MSRRRTGSCVDETGLTLAARPGSVVDVWFGEQRVFSSPPTKFTERNGRVHLAWPKILRPKLHGRTRLVVRDHLTGDVLLDEPVQFGDSDQQVSVTDRQGRPLTVDKFGALVRMFTEAAGPTAQHLATEVARLAGDVNAFGVTGFLAYGSLLGAVRNGHLIGHDTDTDIAYLSRYSHPAEIARESFALERFLVDRGWRIERMRVGLVRAVFHDLSGDVRHIDVFTAVHDGTHLYLNPYVFAELPRSAVEPVGSATLEGVEVPAPADPAAVLTATYGPSYLVPDPSFSYQPPRWMKRKAFTSMGNYRFQRVFWARRARFGPRAERPGVSDFARWVSQREAGATIVDLGCGLGTEALWFAGHGHRVVGIDYLDPSRTGLNRDAARRGLPAEFFRVSLYDVRASLAAGARLAGRPEDELVVYSRHLLDVMEAEGRTNFWLVARTALLRGGRLYLRFRTHGERAEVDEPGFRALDPDMIQAEARARGARVVSRDDEPGATVLVLTWR